MNTDNASFNEGIRAASKYLDRQALGFVKAASCKRIQAESAKLATRYKLIAQAGVLERKGHDLHVHARAVRDMLRRLSA